MKAYQLRKLLWGVFGVLLVGWLAWGIWGCSEEDNYYRTVTAPCCDDGCTTADHSDPCHPDCLTGNKYTICFNDTTMKILKTDWEWYKARGAVKGKCPRGDDDDDDNGDDDDDGNICKGQKVAICHFPPGNPENHHTICIGAPAVPAHLSNHPGDYVGACEDGS